MAEESEAGRGASGIPRVGKRKWGYDVSQVDDFLTRAHALYEGEGVQLTQRDIQDVSFDLAKGGYDIAQVDAALSRLERAVTDKTTAWEIAQDGRVTWKATTMSMFRRIAAHAARPPKARFDEGKAKKPSYDRRQVDRLIDQIIAKSAASLGVDDSQGDAAEIARRLVDLNASSVANVVFTQRRGKHGYDERQVDYYLNACVELLSRLESYARITDYAGDSAAQSGEEIPQTIPSAPVAPAGLVAPLDQPAEAPHQTEPSSIFPPAPSAGTRTEVIAPVGAAGTMSVGPAPAAASDAKPSFEEVRQAEQTVFTPAPSTYSQPQTSSPTTPVVPMRSVDAGERRTLSDSSSHASFPAADEGLSAVGDSAGGQESGGQGDSSLAALAHLAESTHAPVKPDIPSVDIPLPDIKVPNVLWASSEDGDSPSPTGGTGLNPPDGPDSGESFSIPDLSFPVFNDDDSAGSSSTAGAASGADGEDSDGPSQTAGERS